MERISRVRLTNSFLILVMVLLLVLPFLLNHQSEFGGADGAAGELIRQLNTGYEPWFEPLWEPPGAETETLLFTLQAVLGSSFIAYYLGYRIGKKKGLLNNNEFND